VVDFLLQLPFFYIQLLLLVDEGLKGLLGEGVGLDDLDFRYLHFYDSDCLHMLVFITGPFCLYGHLFLVNELTQFGLHVIISLVDLLLCLLLGDLDLPLSLFLSLFYPLLAHAHLFFECCLLPPECFPVYLALLHLVSDSSISRTEPLYVLLEVDLLGIVVTDELLEVLGQAILALG
jgi:hypothetical protein